MQDIEHAMLVEAEVPDRGLVLALVKLGQKRLAGDFAGLD